MARRSWFDAPDAVGAVRTVASASQFATGPLAAIAIEAVCETAIAGIATHAAANEG